MAKHNDEELSFRVVLCQPEIPLNTGNIGRLCLGTNAELHIIKPMRFFINDKYIKKAGLDYWEKVKLFVHNDFNSFKILYPQNKFYLIETTGTKLYTDIDYKRGDILIFGSESKGLHDSLLTEFSDRVVSIPMSDNIRSINLCNAVSIVLYEGLRQIRNKN
jgi:tRNA (cytidine/uridine-2'-O-)-methyltransferase